MHYAVHAKEFNKPLTESEMAGIIVPASSNFDYVEHERLADHSDYFNTFSARHTGNGGQRAAFPKLFAEWRLNRLSGQHVAIGA